MARTDRPGEAVGGGSGMALGSPASRAQLAVSQNQKALAEQARIAKNNEIKKIVQGTQAGHKVTNSGNYTKTVK